MQQGAGGAALGFVDRPATGALAVAFPVFLIDRDDVGVRIARSRASAARASSSSSPSLVMQSWAFSHRRSPLIRLYHSGCAAKCRAGGTRVKKLWHHPMV